MARVCRHSALAAAIVAVFACVHPSAWGETVVFKDVARPHGVQRSQAEKQAAFKTCLDAGVSAENAPAFEACMRRQGWAVGSIRPDSSDKPGATYDDMWQKPDGPKRSDAALETDARACDPAGTTSAESASMKGCMLAHGWRLAFVVPEPREAAPVHASNPRGDTNQYTDIRGGRSDAQAKADAADCESEVGDDPIGQPTSATLKHCMLSHGWRFDRTYQSNNPESREWFDPDHGLVCHSAGFADICSSPEGHGDYYDPKHGMNCHSDGGVKVCTNF
jgi:hypothetical protein